MTATETRSASPQGVHRAYFAQPSALAELDGWRGLAIGAVLLNHLWRVEFMAVGVITFFVLSGLLMGRLLFIQQTRIQTFIWRRFTRVFPALLVYLLVVLLLCLPTADERFWREWWSSAALLRAYVLDRPFASPFPLSQLWSLAVEEHCYLVLALVAWRLRDQPPRRVLVALAALTGACVLAYAAYKLWWPNAASGQFILRSEVSAFPLLLSITLFMALPSLRELRLSSHASWLAFGAAMLAPLLLSRAMTLFASGALLALSINALPWSQGAWIRLLRSPALVWIGRRAYSLYLWQQVFYWSAWAAPIDGDPVGSVLRAALATVCAFAVAEASFRWVEGPARQRLNRYVPDGRSLASA